MDAYRVAFNTWQEKTEWVQKDKRFDVLLPWGKHRADVLKEYIDRLEQQLAESQRKLRSADATIEKLATENAEMKDDYRTTPALKRMGWPKTPATDDFLAKVRLQGMEQLASCLDANGYSDEAVVAREYAAEIRLGGAA